MTQAHQEALGASLLLDKPIETPKRLHWKIRLEAFLLCCSLGFGYHFAWHLLGPLKEPIKEVSYNHNNDDKLIYFFRI
jgi:hypothetical protein